MALANGNATRPTGLSPDWILEAGFVAQLSFYFPRGKLQ